MGPAKLQTEPENTNHIMNSSMVYDLFKKFSLTIYIIPSPTLPSVLQNNIKIFLLVLILVVIRYSAGGPQHEFQMRQKDVVYL